MSSPITQKSIEGAIKQYWCNLFNENQQAIQGLLSPGITVKVQLTVNSEKKAPATYDYQQFLAFISKIGADIASSQNESFAYSNLVNNADGTASLDVKFAQDLTLVDNNQLMKSTGTQTWTFNGTQFVALNVIENDIVNQSSSCLIM